MDQPAPPSVTFREPYELDDSTVERFRRDGHVVLRNVASPAEIDEYRPAIQRGAATLRLETRPLEERDTYGRAFIQSCNLWRVEETVERFVHAPRFGQIAAELLGVERVRLYHDQALFKEPGGGRTPWHQDEFYWPLDTEQTVTMWMPLHDVTAEMGLMSFAVGSHRLGDLRGREISDRSEAEFAELVAEQGLPVSQTPALAAGDASFHAGWTLHCAGANTTGGTREAFTIIFFADGARLRELRNGYERFDAAVWLPGVEVGEIAASPINPIVGEGRFGVGPRPS
jgi:ectoine hydroxylase-related dioxygenase (phytanoyl-CoA dioxygenase family)